MSEIKFSIIVPTYNRCHVLISSIKTVLSQNYSNFELIISDNHSTDNTHEYIQSIDDKRLVYTKPDRHCCMAMNWEHGISVAQGDYIFVLGDDDGLVEGALSEAAKIIKVHTATAICWKKSIYTWPNSASKPNTAWINTKKKSYRLNSKLMLYLLAKGYCHYSYLPTLYNSFIHIGVIENIRSKSDKSVFFASNTPDIYSGIVVASAVDSYIYSEQSFSVSGSSNASNGNAIYLEGATFSEFFDKEEISWHKSVPALAGIIDSSIAEAYLQAYDLNLTKGISFNSRRYISRIKRAVGQLSRKDHRDWAIERLKDFSLITTSEYRSMIDNKLLIDNPPDTTANLAPQFVQGSGELIIDCTQFDITNINDLVNFMGKLLPIGDVSKDPVRGNISFLFFMTLKKYLMQK